MDTATLFEPTFSAIAMLLGAMAVVAAIETRIPLHPRGYWNRAHLGPNLASSQPSALGISIGRADSSSFKGPRK